MNNNFKRQFGKLCHIKNKRRLIYFVIVCLMIATSAIAKYDVLIFRNKIVDTKPVIPVPVTFYSNTTDSDLALTTGFEALDVCYYGTNKTYMLVSSLDPESAQMEYIETYMTAVDGLFYDKDGYVGVALGSYFGEIGSRYIFTLDSGIKLKVVKVEHKADKHTNNGCEQRWDKSVIEFVVDTFTHTFWVGENTYLVSGNFNNLQQYKGGIINISRKLDN